MIKICFITPNTFPVPAIKGGAVETIVTNIINENEKYNKLDITVVSRYDKDLKDINYVKTKFIYIKVAMNDILVKLKLKHSELAERIEKKFKNCKILYAFLRVIFGAFGRVVKLNEYIYSLKAYKRLYRENFDYIIVEGGDPLNYKKILLHFGREKCIFHIHGTMEANNKINKYYSKYFAVSNFVKSKFIENGVVSEGAVYVLPNCINIDMFDKKLSIHERKEMLENLKINKDDVVILYCGRIVPVKGVKELVQAFKSIKRQNVKLLLVGSCNFNTSILSNYERTILSDIAQLKGSIIPVGYIPNNELYKFYNIADFCVFPSLCEEAFGLVVIEAMSSGKSVICTNSGEMPYIVNSDVGTVIKKEYNLISNLTNSIIDFIDDPEECKRKGKLAREFAKKYSTLNTYNKFAEFIERFGKYEESKRK